MKKKKADSVKSKQMAKGKQNSTDAPFQQKRKWFD